MLFANNAPPKQKRAIQLRVSAPAHTPSGSMVSMNEKVIYFPPQVSTELAALVGTTTGPAVLACSKGRLTLTTGGATYDLGPRPAMPARIEITDRGWVARGLAAGLPLCVAGSEVRVGHVSCVQTAGRAYCPSVPSTEPPLQPLFSVPAAALRGFPTVGYLSVRARTDAAYVVGESAAPLAWAVAPAWCRVSAGPVSAAAAGHSRLFFLPDNSVAVVGGRRAGVWAGPVYQYPPGNM